LCNRQLLERRFASKSRTVESKSDGVGRAGANREDGRGGDGGGDEGAVRADVVEGERVAAHGGIGLNR